MEGSARLACDPAMARIRKHKPAEMAGFCLDGVTSADAKWFGPRRNDQQQAGARDLA
jgi:hypothetical protein